MVWSQVWGLDSELILKGQIWARTVRAFLFRLCFGIVFRPQNRIQFQDGYQDHSRVGVEPRTIVQNDPMHDTEASPTTVALLRRGAQGITMAHVRSRCVVTNNPKTAVMHGWVR